MCRLVERDEVHLGPFFCNVKKLEHEVQIVPAIVTDANQVAMCDQLLLKSVEMA